MRGKQHHSTKSSTLGIKSMILGVIAVFAISTAGLTAYRNLNSTTLTDNPDDQSRTMLAESVPLESPVETVSALLGQTQTYTLPSNYVEPTGLPAFAKFDSNTRIITISPTTKSHLGTTQLSINSTANSEPPLLLTLEAKLNSVDMAAMEAEIQATIGLNNPDMGIYIEDLKRNVTYQYNSTKEFKPGSISKLPVGFITLLDLQAGKITLDTTFPVNNKFKHSTYDNIGSKAQGTPITINTYLTELYRLSNNTAQYHLREIIGNPTQDPNIWSSGVLNQRVSAELGVSQWSEDPHRLTPVDVAKVWRDIYNGSLYQEKWKNYFFDTLGSASSSLREGIPAGIPRTATGVRVVNKVGFLYGGADNTYSDCGIVFGVNTDYLIGVYNNKAPAFPQGKEVIRKVSAIAYKYLDKN